MIYLKIKHILPLFFILVLFFILRYQNILSIPVFGDEAIYLRWSQLIKNVETLRFVPQSDGKQPLFMWFTAVIYKFISDPLLAGRSISILSGGLTMITIFIFSKIFLSSKIAYISTLVYLLLPFTFFFDRLALPDTLLSCFGVISMLFAFLLAKYPRLDLSLILGFFLGLSWLTKSPAIYFIILSWITFIFYQSSNYKKIYFPLLSTGLSFLIYNLLRLGPQFNQIALRNRDYVWSLADILQHPLDPFIPHLKDIFTIYSTYISIPVIIISLAGIYLSKKYKSVNNLYYLLIIWWLFPTISNAVFAKVFTARYILFTLPSLIILISIGLNNFLFRSLKYFNKVYFQYIFIFLSVLPNLFWISKISLSPFNSTLTSTESGYISSWTSGWGIKEAANYLISRSKVANVIVGTEGYFGTLPDGLQIYTDSLKQLTIFGVGININKIPDKLIDARNHQDEVYLLFNSSRLRLPQNELEKLTLISTTPKPDNDSLVLYRLN